MEEGGVSSGRETFFTYEGTLFGYSNHDSRNGEIFFGVVMADWGGGGEYRRECT
jgi:hypothetical protein